MLARSNLDVDDLNTLAREHALDTGAVHGDPLLTAGGRGWQVGDRLRVTRNDRQIPVGADHLRNGDTFTVTGRSATGLTVQRLDGDDVAELPADYVAEHARYGWASTIASAQGATVDAALLLARPGLDRTNLYVGLTRGRDSNHIYLAPEPEPEISPRGSRRSQPDAATQLRTMLDTLDVDTAAHTRLRAPLAPPPLDWQRHPTRAELHARAIAAANQRRHRHRDPEPYLPVIDLSRDLDRGYGRGR
jgi:ATP-dependent exoDNAse (exonuclease V) alpha subunit